MKKAQTTTLIMRIISVALFILVFFASMAFGARLYNAVAGGSGGVLDHDFNSTSPLRVAQESAVILLNPGSDFNYKVNFMTGDGDPPVHRGIYWERPLACPRDKSCVCLCENFAVARGENTGERLEHIQCETTTCRSSEDFLLPEEIIVWDVFENPIGQKKYDRWINSFIFLNSDSIGSFMGTGLAPIVLSGYHTHKINDYFSYNIVRNEEDKTIYFTFQDSTD